MMLTAKDIEAIRKRWNNRNRSKGDWQFFSNFATGDIPALLAHVAELEGHIALLNQELHAGASEDEHESDV